MQRLFGLLLVVTSSSAMARDVVVIDRGGGSARVAAATRALTSAGDVVLPAEDAARLDRDYAAGCTDAGCFARAGAVVSVDAIVIVRPADVELVDVASDSSRHRSAAQLSDVPRAIDDLRHPERFGTLDMSALPAGAAVAVNGAPWRGEELPAGPVTIVVTTDDGRTALSTVTVVPGTAVRVPPPPKPSPEPSAIPAPSSPQPPPIPDLNPSLVLAAVAGSTAVAGLAIGIVGEVLAQQALDQLNQQNPAPLVAMEVVEAFGFTVAGVGAVVAIASVVMFAADEPD